MENNRDPLLPSKYDPDDIIDEDYGYDELPFKDEPDNEGDFMPDDFLLNVDDGMEGVVDDGE